VNLFLRNLILCVLLLIPVHAQAAAASAPVQDNPAVSEPAPPAADPGPIAPLPETQQAEMQFPVMRTIGGMGLVVFLMVGLFFAAKKLAPRYFNKPVSQRNLKILETLGMGDRRSISLIEVGNGRYLVGNTPHQISLLAALPEPVSLVSEPEEVPAPPKSANRKVSGAPFRSLFEVEKGRPAAKNLVHPLPDDLRLKMRQLRDALERS